MSTTTIALAKHDQRGVYAVVCDYDVHRCKLRGFIFAEAPADEEPERDLTVRLPLSYVLTDDRTNERFRAPLCDADGHRIFWDQRADVMGFLVEIGLRLAEVPGKAGAVRLVARRAGEIAR